MLRSPEQSGRDPFRRIVGSGHPLECHLNAFVGTYTVETEVQHMVCSATRTVGEFAALAFALAAMILIGTTSHADAGPEPDELEFDAAILDELSPGKRAMVIVGGHPLFLLRPDDEVLRDLQLLDNALDTASSHSYNAELDVFAYWGSSPYFGCLLIEVPKGDPSAPQSWLGGYIDPCYDQALSFDYAGRALSGDFQFVPDNTRQSGDLQAPTLELTESGTIRVSPAYSRQWREPPQST